MPNHGKGGRKRQGDEVKSPMVPLRVEPALRARLDEMLAKARAEGRPSWSLTREVEERVKFSFLFDGQADAATIELLKEIASDIHRAEELTGKRWNTDLRTWAMVRAAMQYGAIDRLCPEHERIETDESAYTHLGTLKELEDKMSDYVKILGSFGINVYAAREPVSAQDPTPRTNRDVAMRLLQESQNPEIAKAEALRTEILPGRIDNLIALEDEYREAHLDYRLSRTFFNEVVNEATEEWKESEARFRREYRKGDALTPYTPQHNTGGMSVTLPVPTNG